MGILNVLLYNSRRASRARPPSDPVELPSGFRGALAHDTSQCVGCTTCRYVCSPGAIKFANSALDGITWQYQSTQCTFCGKCVEYCPTKALRFEQMVPQLMAFADTISHRVEYHPCPSCGEQFAPLPVPTIERLYRGYATEETMRLMRICEKCRKRATVETWKASLTGELHLPGGGQ
jgi:ferredoxin